MFYAVASNADWTRMVTCADEVLEAARVWWPDGSDFVRSQLADPLKTMAESVAFHRKHDRTPRPMHAMGQQALMWACYRAAEEIRLTVSHDRDGSEALWDAAARLAFVTTGIKADVVTHGR